MVNHHPLPTSERLVLADYHHGVQDGVVDNDVDAVVHLLIDDVQGENTKGVMLLQGSGRTKLLEGTFRNLGKITISSVLQSVVELNSSCYDLLTLGKTLFRGSSRTLIGSSICVRTSLRER